MQNEIILREPETAVHENAGGLLVAQANEVVVTNNDEREVAGAFLSEISGKIKLIEMEFDGTEDSPGPTKKAHAAWKSMVSLRDKALLSFKSAKEIISRKIQKFEYDVEQARLEENRRNELVARKKAEDDRKREIEAAKASGDKEAAKALKTAPLSVQTAPVSVPEVPKVAGMRRSAPVWDFQIVDAAKLPRKYLMPDEKAIRNIVKALGQEHGIPGVSVFDSRSRGI